MTYDLLVIGSGPGGYVAAIRAAQYGLQVGVVEKAPKLGGTCLHVGCVPTKAFLHFAQVYEELGRSADYGILHSDLGIDMEKMRAHKNRIVLKHAKGIAFLFKKHKIRQIAGFGRLLGGGKVEVAAAAGETTVYSPKAVILATGSEARLLPGLEADSRRILTNIEILDLHQLPRSLAVIGAGAVGMEFASIYRSFGAETTVIEMLPRVLPLEDEEVSAELARAFKKRKIKLLMGSKVGKIEAVSDGVRLEVEGPDGRSQTMEAEKLLVAVGRKPNTEKIGLENTKIESERGYVKVDRWLETAERGVYAIGDIVAGTPQLAHAASMEGIVAAARIAGRPVEPINYLLCPAATYCEPQVAGVGLTEAQAREKGYKVKIGKFNFAGNSKASILGAHGGFVKVVAEEKHGEILGVHIIGPQATDLISEAVTAMASEATVESMMATIHAHPTLPEAVQDAFNAVYGLAING